MAYIVMAYIVMAYIVMAYIVMAYIVMAYIVMAICAAGDPAQSTRPAQRAPAGDAARAAWRQHADGCRAGLPVVGRIRRPRLRRLHKPGTPTGPTGPTRRPRARARACAIARARAPTLPVHADRPRFILTLVRRSSWRRSTRRRAVASTQERST